MKSYLSLVPISAKVRKRQNRMTVFCIVISVLLVTAIFSVADSSLQAEAMYMQSRHGSWHIRLEHISGEVAEQIRQRPDVLALGWAAEYNEDVDQPYYIGERKATLYGTDSVYMTQLTNSIEEGSFPQSEHEVLLSSNAKLALNVEIGDTVTLDSPAGKADFTVSGFGSDDKEYYQGQTYLVAVYMTHTAFSSLMEENGLSIAPRCYVQFESAASASSATREIEQEYEVPADSISENTAVMGIAGQSSNASMKNFYVIAAILFVLVLLAGILMISGNMNSNVAQRTKFFGMMRCIGASRSQIIRFVRMEALNWCKTAVPIGMILGTGISWGICALLRYGIGGEFAETPVLQLSPIGLFSGALVGTATVLLAAQSPAKRAARVSPVAAISGNDETAPAAKHPVKIGFGKLEWTLGFHHATASKKNWLLMTASFSLSIILFLCFSVGLNFARELLPSLRSWQPDISLNGYANTLLLEPEILHKIEGISGVAHIYGTAYKEEIPAASSDESIDHVNLVSYSAFLLDCTQDIVIAGDVSTVYGNTGNAMTVASKDNPLKVGDTIQIEGKTVKITCAVSSGIWPDEYSVICSEETFEWLTGEKNFSLIGVQLDKNADEEAVRQISGMADPDVIFSDIRESNRSDGKTYLAVCLVLYSFVTVLAVITLFNIVNSISMSVSAHIKQYGAMRAVGMDGKQLSRMIGAEAFTYAISGLVVGCGVGLALSQWLHHMLLTRYFGIRWHLPVTLLVIIIAFDLVAAAIAVYAPAKRIRNMAITETINEL